MYRKATARKQGVDVKEPAEVTMSNILDGPIKRPDESKLFKTVEERCADARSTAMTLLLVGVLGLAAMILAITGSLQLPLPKIAPYSMSVLFLAFIGWLWHRFKSRRRFWPKDLRSMRGSRILRSGLRRRASLLRKLQNCR